MRNGPAGGAPPRLDGELVAWDNTGPPDWHRVGARVLHGDTSIPVSFITFDVLACEGLPVTELPYSKPENCSSSSTWSGRPRCRCPD